MKPSFHPVPTDHGEYDAHLLRASLQGPAVKIMTMQERENRVNPAGRRMNFSNPWGAVPWHTEIRIPYTELTIQDFTYAVRAQFESVLRRSLPVHLRGNLSSARTLLSHLAHTFVQNGVALHAQAMTVEELISNMRQDMKCIYPEGIGAYVLETPAHPLWGMQGTYESLSDQFIAFVPEKRPTVAEKGIAKFLCGPDIVRDGPDGIMSEILTQVQPFLLWKDGQFIVERSSELRRRLRSLLDDDPAFSEATRTACVELIVNEWTQSVTDDFIAVAGGTETGQSAEELIHEYFPPEVIADPQAFAQRMPLLEQHTIQLALETQGADRERNMADFRLIDDAWMQALTAHPTLRHLCDHPSMGLVYLAAFARFQPPEFFRDHI